MSQQLGYFKISGPFGRGIIQEEVGTYAIFAAGTGVLCFLDLVAHVAQQVLHCQRKSKLLLSKSKKDTNAQVESGFEQKPFRVVMYLSFGKRADSIGLELCERLDQYCKENKLDNFQLHLRLS